MKKLLILLTLGLMFGQTKVETRLYEITFNWSVNAEEHPIDLFELTGYNISNAIVNFFSATNINVGNNVTELAFEIYRMEDDWAEVLAKAQTRNFDNSLFDNTATNIMPGESFIYTNAYDYKIRIQQGYQLPGSVQLTFAITAEFPDMDTGYMEEDFDFCINEGLNLVSYPCENDIAINDALPSEISNNLSSIVGEGVAGINVNGTWVGSLTQLQAGSGYWFNSSMEACFNYECAEN